MSKSVKLYNDILNWKHREINKTRVRWKIHWAHAGKVNKRINIFQRNGACFMLFHWFNCISSNRSTRNEILIWIACLCIQAHAEIGLFNNLNSLTKMSIVLQKLKLKNKNEKKWQIGIPDTMLSFFTFIWNLLYFIHYGSFIFFFFATVSTELQSIACTLQSVHCTYYRILFLRRMYAMCGVLYPHLYIFMLNY